MWSVLIVLKKTTKGVWNSSEYTRNRIKRSRMSGEEYKHYVGKVDYLETDRARL
jgi:hypothetical protein